VTTTLTAPSPEPRCRYCGVVIRPVPDFKPTPYTDGAGQWYCPNGITQHSPTVEVARSPMLGWLTVAPFVDQWGREQ
jgi:hypothetical protein